MTLNFKRAAVLWITASVVAALCGGCEESIDPAASDRVTPEPDDVGEPEPVGDRIRVATWNVKRFFDTVCDTGSCNGSGDFESAPESGDFVARADEIADAIANLDADVVLLQEIETVACMDALEERLADQFDLFLLGEVRQAASLDTAVLARGELVEVITHRQNPIDDLSGGTTRFARELLEVRLDIDGHRLVVFSAHFRSQRNDDSEQRLAEATASNDIVLEAAAQQPGAMVIFGGDLNDEPGSESIDALTQGGRLSRVAEELGEDDWTFASARGTSTLDHLFLVTRQGGDFVAGTAQVVRDGNFYGGSDHSALTATFEFPPR